MIDFPNHDALIAKAHEALHSQFEFSERVFNYWIGQEKNKYLWRGHLDELVVNVGATLDVQACRQFRTVIDLCQRCEGYDASVIARSLFETSLAMLFVLTEKHGANTAFGAHNSLDHGQHHPADGRVLTKDFERLVGSTEDDDLPDDAPFAHP